MRGGHALFSAALLLAACRSVDSDLTLAIKAEVGRTARPSAEKPRPFDWVELGLAHAGNDTLRLAPASLCMNTDRLYVGDAPRRRVVEFTLAGEPRGSFGGTGTSEGAIVEVTLVRCAAGSDRVAVGDRPLHRISVFHPDSGLVHSFAAPETPQIRVLSDIVPRADGAWYASWLGSALPFGAYLEGAAWDSARLVQLLAPDGVLTAEAARPRGYRDPVARRVLNRTFMAVRRDSLWVLTQGDATLRAFSPSGAEAEAAVLAVHFRGREPKISVRAPLGPGSEFRPARYAYHPNVQGLAVVQDSLFATLRYREWRHRVVGRGWDRTMLPRASSALEVFTRSGRVLYTLDVPGHALEVASGGGVRVAVLTALGDGSHRVLLGTLPSPSAQHP